MDRKWGSTWRSGGTREQKLELNTEIEPTLRTSRFGKPEDVFSTNPEINSRNSIITQADYMNKLPMYNYEIPIISCGIPEPFLGNQSDNNLGKKTLVLDLDETLVHSSFSPVLNADIVMKIEIESIFSKVYVLVRPGTYLFLE